MEYLSLVRFQFTCAMNLFVYDSNESIDTTSSRVLASLISLTWFLLLHGFWVAFAYIQFVHSGLSPFGSCYIDLGMILCIDMVFCLLNVRWFNLTYKCIIVYLTISFVSS